VISPGTPVLLDTSIVIHLARGGVAAERLESRFGFRSRSLPLTPLISAVTVGELFAFAERNEWGARKRESLEQLVSNLIVIDIRRPGVLRTYAALDHASEAVRHAHGAAERRLDRRHRRGDRCRAHHRGPGLRRAVSRASSARMGRSTESALIPAILHLAAVSLSKPVLSFRHPLSRHRSARNLERDPPANLHRERHNETNRSRNAPVPCRGAAG
jgi:predicted nucleic acid-binding protein